jgi:hypothetical protein
MKVWIYLLIVMMTTLEYSLLNFQLMGERLWLEVVMLQYTFMISKQTKLASKYKRTRYDTFFFVFVSSAVVFF